MSEKLYAERDMETLWPNYIKHISAMTGEGLHDKADIASELAYRDAEIERKDAAIAEMVAAMRRMAFHPTLDAIHHVKDLIAKYDNNGGRL